MALIVRPYSIQCLKDVIAAGFDPPQTTPPRVGDKSHLGYFETYFANADTHAETIVIEEPYTDRDFLEDFAAYYVRCFNKYNSRCCRLHFFALKFTQADLDGLIRGEQTTLTEESLCNQDNYLGFVVIRPLPRTFIGRTCLRTYSNDNGRRQYPVTRDYKVHLAGFTLTVRSLAFQEQDRATSACATSALWSAFHGTGVLFHHSIHSPVEITRDAVRRIPGMGRTFPNSGLTVWQMASAVSEIGLEPDSVDVSTENMLQGISYAYLRASIPLLLVVSLYDATDPQDVKDFDEFEPDTGHALAVTGFSLGKANAAPHPKHGTLFRHSRIDKLYVHDDQLGPFAKVGLSGALCRKGQDGNPVSVCNLSMTTSWKNKAGRMGGVRFVPKSIIIPLYHKIRISYSAILAKIFGVDNVILEPIRANAPNVLPHRLEWDVFLTTGWAIQEAVRTSQHLSADERHDLIQEQYPRFVWRAIGLCGTRPVIDVLYDATDIETGDFRLGVIWYDKNVLAAANQL